MKRKTSLLSLLALLVVVLSILACGTSNTGTTIKTRVPAGDAGETTAPDETAAPAKDVREAETRSAAVSCKMHFVSLLPPDVQHFTRLKRPVFA